jgi:S-disulfanyl-L-cysteine oxidoreductase SoxD
VIQAILVAAFLFWVQAAASTKDGVYTAVQAGRGKEIYASACAGCHSETLEGSGQIPPLAGPEFLDNWKGQTLADLFDKMKTTMPADAPGKLSNEENIDLIAFLLSFNKFPAGSAELKYDLDRLRRIRIE